MADAGFRSCRGGVRRRPGLSALVTVEGADELESALLAGSDVTHQLDATDGRYTIVLGRVVYVKRYAREAKVGFGI